MKKFLIGVLSMAMVLSTAACGGSTQQQTAPAAEEAAAEETEEAAAEETEAAAAEETAEEESATAVSKYEIYNRTGEKVTELYIYEAGTEDKGTNYADQIHGNHASLDLGELPTGVDFILEFVTEGGRVGTFETLHAEEAPITLLAEDAITGATQIAFEVPVEPAQYEVTNSTGEVVTDLYVYEVGSADKGTNHAGDGMADAATVSIDYGENPVSIVYTIEYTTESGRNAQFDTLSVEVAPIYLLAEDAMTGATPISFMAPR